MTFEPGQYVEITLPHRRADTRGLRRMFSIASAPGDEYLRLGVKFYQPSSSFKTALRQLTAGSSVAAVHIGGDFVLPKDKDIPLLFIAGGIGITPFISHIHHLRKQNEARNIILMYAVNTVSEIAYADVLAQDDVKVFVVTPDESSSTVSPVTFVQSQYITEDIIRQFVPEAKGRHVYISGPPVMVHSMKKIVRGMGVQKIHTDYFTGY